MSTTPARRVAHPVATWLAIAALTAPAAANAQQTVKPAPHMSAHDVDMLPEHTPGKILTYKGGFGSLRVPPGKGPFALAILVHGGCYLTTYAGLKNTNALAEALTAAGIATWNIEYPRYDETGGGWPGTFDKVGAATDYVRTFSKSSHIDTTRVIAIGHSAGGQLALWLASRRSSSSSSSPAPLHIAGVVALGPITDMREFYKREQQTCGNPAIESVLGGVPDSVPDRIRAVSPIERLPLRVPVILIAGSDDFIAPRNVLDAYAIAARAKGDSVVIVTTPGEGHFEALAPDKATGKAAIQAALTLSAESSVKRP